MKIKFKRDLSSGIFLMIVSIVLWFMIPSNIVVPEGEEAAQLFPKMLVGGMFLLSAFISIKSFITKKDETMELDLMKEGKVILYMFAILVYIILVDKIGFLISTFIISALTLFIFKAEKKLYPILGIFIIFVYLLFKYALSIPLP